MGEKAAKWAKQHIGISQSRDHRTRPLPNTECLSAEAINQLQVLANRIPGNLLPSLGNKDEQRRVHLGWEVGDDISSLERWGHPRESDICATAGEAFLEKSISVGIRLPMAVLPSRAMCALDRSAAGEYNRSPLTPPLSLLPHDQCFVWVLL